MVRSLALIVLLLASGGADAACAAATRTLIQMGIRQCQNVTIEGDHATAEDYEPYDKEEEEVAVGTV